MGRSMSKWAALQRYGHSSRRSTTSSKRRPKERSLNLLHLRGHGVAHSQIEQFNFLSGFFGGPQLYTEKHGHSDVREMHRHIDVSPAERDAWLLCMSKAIKQIDLDDDIGEALMKHFRVVANALEIENRVNAKTRFHG